MRLKRYLVMLLLMLLLLTALPAAHADAVRLTSGQVVTGKIIKESKTEIHIETKSGVLTIRKSEILEIEGGKSKSKISRFKRTPGIFKTILYSYVPFYSGFFEHGKTEYGIPFSFAGGFFFLRLAEIYVFGTPYTDWHNSDLLRNMNITGYIEAERTGRSSSRFFRNSQRNLEPFITIKYLRAIPVKGYRVRNTFYTRGEMREIKNRNFRNYFYSSTAGAAATFLYLRYFSGSRGTPAAGQTAPGKVHFIAFPESKKSVLFRLGVSF